jgi:hypothetical protein
MHASSMNFRSESEAHYNIYQHHFDQSHYKVVSQLHRTLSFFSDSTDSANHLEEVRKELGIHCGFEKIGKTRFGSIYWSTESLRRCLPALQIIVSNPDHPVNITVCRKFPHLQIVSDTHTEFEPFVHSGHGHDNST